MSVPLKDTHHLAFALRRSRMASTASAFHPHEIAGSIERHDEVRLEPDPFWLVHATVEPHDLLLVVRGEPADEDFFTAWVFNEALACRELVARDHGIDLQRAGVRVERILASRVDIRRPFDEWVGGAIAISTATPAPFFKTVTVEVGTPVAASSGPMAIHGPRLSSHHTRRLPATPVATLTSTKALTLAVTPEFPVSMENPRPSP